MSDRKKVPASAGDEAKAERLALALRANLKRRKTQSRAQSKPAPTARTDAETSENPRKTADE